MSTKDLPFTCQTLRYGPSHSQEADLYLPSIPRPPVVCLLHGGFWRMPYGRNQMLAVAEDLVSRGYAVWNIGYRRVGEAGGGWPGSLVDVASAVDHLATLVHEGMDLDLDRVATVGHSAGGQLALWSAAKTLETSLPGPVRVQPMAVAALAAVADLRAAWKLGLGSGAVAAFLGGSPSERPERYAAASPLERLPLGTRQLILHGTLDEALPVGLSQDYAAAAQAAGDDVAFVELASTGHMDYLDPRSEAHATLCDWLTRIIPARHRGLR